MKHKRTCSKCKRPIAKFHKWHTVYHRFLWFTWTTVEHRDCQHPEQIHKHVVRLKGEVPLPFMDMETTAKGLSGYPDPDAKPFTFHGGTHMSQVFIYEEKKDVN